MTHFYFKLLGLLLLFVPFQMQAQIKPFDDYSKCQIGFLNTRRDTVYPAKFEHLTEINVFDYNKANLGNNVFYQHESTNKEWNSWILSENGKFGCLSTSGEWFLPCKYESIEFLGYFNAFLVQLDGKFGIVSVGDTLILPCEFDEISPKFYGKDFNNKFFVKKGDLTGIYTVMGEQVVAVNYETINQITTYNRENDWLDYFIVSKKKLIGVLSQKGETIIEPKFRMIDLLMQYNFPGAETLFRVEDTLGRFSVFNGEGKQLLEFKDFPIKPVYTLSYISSRKGINYIERRDFEDRKQLANLTTGKESDWYQGLNFIGDEVFAYSIRENSEWDYDRICDWKVLDSNFNVIYSNSDPADQLFFWSYNGEPDLANRFPNQYEEEELVMYKQELEDSYGIDRNPTVFLISKTVLFNRKGREKHDYWDDKNYYSLLNARTGKQTPFIYDDIFRIGGKNRFYYWGMRNSVPWAGDDELTVDIYDDSATFLQTVCLEWQEFESAKRSNAMYQNQFELLFIQNNEFKSGIIRPDGHSVMPCVIDGDMWIYGMNDSVGVIYCKLHSDDFKLFDLKAQPLFDGDTFDELYYYNPNLFYLRSGNRNMFISSDLEIVFDSCSTPIQLDNYSNLGLKRSCRAIVGKGSYYYGIFDDGIHIMDSGVFRYPSNKNWLVKEIYVDNSGKITYYKKEKAVEPITDHLDRIYVTLVNKELKVQGVKKELIQVIKDVDHYLLRNGNLVLYMTSGKEGLLNTMTGKWLLKPVYSHVKAMATDRNDVFWAKDKSVDAKKWFVVRGAEGTPITEPIFDTTFYMGKTQAYQSFVSNGLTGFVNAKFEIVTPARFQRSIEAQQKTIWVDNNTFHLVDPSTGKTFQVQRNLACWAYPKGQLFLFNDSIQILGLDGRELLPAMPLQTAISSVNLRNYLYEPASPEKKLPFLSGNQIYCANTDSVLWRLNNWNLIEKARQAVVSIDMLKNANSKEGKVLFRQECSVESIFVSRYLYSEKIIGPCYDQPYSNATKQNFSFRNYLVEPGGPRVFELSELFIEGSDYENRLYRLMEEAIQRNQVFGTNCPDMPGAIREFKHNFYMLNNEIHFFYYANFKEIRVPLGSLKDVMKHPEYLE